MASHCMEVAEAVTLTPNMLFLGYNMELRCRSLDYGHIQVLRGRSISRTEVMLSLPGDSWSPQYEAKG